MKSAFVGLALVATLVVGARAAEAPLYIHPLMKDVVAPQAQILWDVGNKGMDDEGKADASKLSADDWTKLAAAARAMKAAASQLAAAPNVAVAAPGSKIQDEGAPGSTSQAQIQSYIAKDPKDFAEHARALVAVTDGFLAAVPPRDAARLMAASEKLDQVCESCHMKYWYPEQK